MNNQVVSKQTRYRKISFWSIGFSLTLLGLMGFDYMPVTNNTVSLFLLGMAIGLFFAWKRAMVIGFTIGPGGRVNRKQFPRTFAVVIFMQHLLPSVVCLLGVLALLSGFLNVSL